MAWTTHCHQSLRLITPIFDDVLLEHGGLTHVLPLSVHLLSIVKLKQKNMSMTFYQQARVSISLAS